MLRRLDYRVSVLRLLIILPSATTYRICRSILCSSTLRFLLFHCRCFTTLPTYHPYWLPSHTQPLYPTHMDLLRRSAPHRLPFYFVVYHLATALRTYCSRFTAIPPAFLLNGLLCTLYACVAGGVSYMPSGSVAHLLRDPATFLPAQPFCDLRVCTPLLPACGSVLPDYRFPL